MSNITAFSKAMLVVVLALAASISGAHASPSCKYVDKSYVNFTTAAAACLQSCATSCEYTALGYTCNEGYRECVQSNDGVGTWKNFYAGTSGCSPDQPYVDEAGQCLPTDKEKENDLGDPGNNGSCSSGVSGAVGNPISIISGNKYQHEVDFVSSIGEMPLRIERSYNSFDYGIYSYAADVNVPWSTQDRIGIFGRNWSSNLDSRLYFINEDKIQIILPDGRRIQFHREGSTNSWSAENTIDHSLVNGNEKYKLNSIDGDQLTFSPAGRLLEQKNKKNQTLTFEYTENLLTKVKDSYGNTLSITYENQVVDKIIVMGMTYDYGYIDANGNLLSSVSYSDAQGAIQSKIYEYTEPDHITALTGIVDETGQRYASWSYDISGRATRSEHAGKEVVEIDYTHADNSTPRYAKVTKYVDDINNTQAELVSKHYIEASPLGGSRLSHFEVDGSVTSCSDAKYNSFNSSNQVEVTTHGNGAVSKFGYDANGNRNLRISGYKWNSSNGKPTIDLGDLVETARMSRVDTQWDASLRQPLEIKYSGKAAGAWSEYQKVNFVYNAEGRVERRIITDLTQIGAPYSTNGRTRTWNYTYTYHDAEKSQLATIATDGPIPGIQDTDISYLDNQGRLVQSTNALGHSIQYSVFNSQGLPTRIVDENGIASTVDYNEKQQVTSYIQASETAEAVTTSYGYYPNGKVRRITLAVGTAQENWIEYSYDASRHLTKVENSQGDYSILTPSVVDGRPLKIEVHDTSGILRYAYQEALDELGRLITIYDANSLIVREYNYDDQNRTVTQNTAESPATEVKKSYNQLKELFEIQHADGNPRYVSYYDYDAQGNLSGVTDQEGNLTRYLYDGFGQLIQLNSADTGISQYWYDEAGNLKQETNQSGQVIEYDYDLLSRIKEKRYVGFDSETVVYTYDDTTNGNHGIGRLTAIAGPSGGYERKYDALGRLIYRGYTVEGGLYEWRYHFGVADYLTQMEYPSGRLVDYSYENGQLIALKTRRSASAEQVTLVDAMVSLPFGPLTEANLGNGLQLTKVFDLNYALDDIGVKSGSLTSLYRDYSYTRAGNIDQIFDEVDSTKSQSFNYDNSNRLIFADGIYGRIEYQYDGVGNRKLLTLDSNKDGVIEESDSYLYDISSNRLVSITAQSNIVSSILHDANGNITHNAWAGTTFSYNAAERLVGAQINGITANYTYNSQGQRVTKTISGPNIDEHIQYHYGLQGELRAETKGDGTLIAEYIYLNSEPIAVVKPGSIGPMSNGTGTVPASVIYSKKYSAVEVEGGATLSGTSVTSYDDAAHAGRSTLAVQGKVYIELNNVSPYHMVGVASENATYNWYTGAVNSAYYYVANGGLYGVATGSGGIGSFSGTVGVAIDSQTKRFWLRQSDGSWLNGDPITGEGGMSFASLSGSEVRVAVNNGGAGSGTLTIDLNLGEQAFIHSTPEGYKAGLFRENVVDPEVYFIHNDHLNTPQLVTNYDQKAVWRAQYKPFGEAVVDEDPDADGVAVEMPLRFPGQYFDQETGLHYNYFRDYDPTIGRYIQSDPIGLAGGVNTYGYVLQNPLIYSDPKGLVTSCQTNPIQCSAAGMGSRGLSPNAGNAASGATLAAGQLSQEKTKTPEEEGRDAAEHLEEDESCPDADPDRNGENCREIRLRCKNICIGKFFSKNRRGNSGAWVARCETTCSRVMGCSPHPY
ncbi:RHS repeat-associated core domain-containing protein [Exilibacterium tricleocarpae]|nr:RHS repeat-associated core domain-containing protein [Exilibacterium tricleocarpae]